MAPRNPWSRLLLGGFFACTLPAAAADGIPDLKRAEAIVSARCVHCHGLNGEAASAVFPRLAGQHAEYLGKQLAEFKNGRRRSDIMKPQAEGLDEDDMKALGAYFERKRTTAKTSGDPELLAVGRYIYNQGNRFSGLPGCLTCHGAKAHGTAQLPRLAGQHPRYIEDQLRQFNKRERTNDNAIMHAVASKLSELEAHAVAEYVASLE